MSDIEAITIGGAEIAKKRHAVNCKFAIFTLMEKRA